MRLLMTRWVTALLLALVACRAASMRGKIRAMEITTHDA